MGEAKRKRAEQARAKAAVMVGLSSDAETVASTAVALFQTVHPADALHRWLLPDDDVP